MFSFTILTIRPVLSQRTVIYHVTELIASKTHNFLRTFLWMMCRRQTISATVFIRTRVIKMTEAFASETLYIFVEISKIIKINTDTLLSMEHLQRVFQGRLFVTRPFFTLRKLSKIKFTCLLQACSCFKITFSQKLPVSVAGYYFVFFASSLIQLTRTCKLYFLIVIMLKLKKERYSVLMSSDHHLRQL